MPHFHLVARSHGWLYTRDAEAAHLWRSLRRAFPEAHAACLMPDHLHLLLPHADQAGRLARVRGGYARWLKHHPQWVQPLRWAPTPPPEELASDPSHLRRTIRYVHLNPCRARLVTDPLAWTWSTHRDATAFAYAPWVQVASPGRFHAVVSGDPTVQVSGTLLPRVQAGVHGLAAISRVVESVFRCAAPETVHGPARRYAVRTAAAFDHRDVHALADWATCSPRQVQRLLRDPVGRWDPVDDPVLAGCIRGVGDPRLADGLVSGELPRLPSWRAYRERRTAMSPGER